MPSVLDDDDDDVERGNSSVTPLRYTRRPNSNIPSATDLTGLRGTAISKIKARPSTAAGARVKPPRSTAAGAKVKPPPRSTAAFQDDHSDTTTTAMIHPAATDLLTSTVILMPEANESENNHVDSIQAVV